MFGISGFELLIIVAFVLLIFGPDKLPELARLIGRATRMFKQAQSDMERVIRAEMITGEKPEGTLTAKSPAAPAEPAVGAATSAATVWAATAEDDDEEEDEE